MNPRIRYALVGLSLVFTIAQALSAVDYLAADEQAAAYRTGTIDPRVLQVPAPIQAGLKRDGEGHLKQLVDFLSSDAGDDFLKVKRIHDWITENIAYDNEGFYGGDKATNPLQDRRTTCGGFAGVFASMAKLAGLNAIIIQGKSRVTFDTKSGSMATHVWNGVEINGKWYIVDTTHDDRFGFDKGRFGKKGPYRDTQLFIAPSAKIIENIPDEERFQFLSSPKSMAEFLAAPQVAMRFGRLGLSFPAGAPALVKEKQVGRGTRYLSIVDQFHLDQNKMRIRLSAPPEVALFARVNASNGKFHDAHALCHTGGQYTDCEFSAPGTGEFTAYISARDKTSEKLYVKVYEFTIVGKNGKGVELPEPNRLYVLDACAAFGIKIINHNLADISAQEYFLEIEHPGTTTVFSTLWDANDRKIGGTSTTTANGRVRYTYKPGASGAYFVKLRVKPADAKLFNDTAALVKIIRQ